MIKLFLSFILLVSFPVYLHAEQWHASGRDSLLHAAIKPKRYIHYVTIGTGMLSSQVPFWMRANQSGDMPVGGYSRFAEVRSRKDYKADKLVSWKYGVDGRLNVGKQTQFILVEGYVQGKVGIFALTAGRERQLTGLVDSTLSVGAFALSGNALGIPKVEISIPEFYALPLMDGVVAVKGNLAHGWLGTMHSNPIRRKNIIRVGAAQTYFHQKSLYGRLGHPAALLRLYGGFNHQVFWGNEEDLYGSSFHISRLESYAYVLTGKTMNKRINGFEKGKIGNHLGSIDVGADINIGNVNVYGYRQNFYDVGALAHLANVKDGLNGLRIENRAMGRKQTYWKKFVFEFLYTKSQAGEVDARLTKSGDENYYNGFYAEGWSYKGVALGTPFISTRTSTRTGLPNDSRDFFNNNRVVAVNAASEFVIKNFAVIARCSYSNNYGTYGTSPFGHSRGEIRHANHGLFPESRQFSGFLQVQRLLSGGLEVSTVFALDRGSLLDNSTGGIFSVRKTF